MAKPVRKARRISKRKLEENEKQLLDFFIQQVRLRAEKRKLPMYKVAELGGMSAGHLSMIMSKQRICGIHHLARLAYSLECEPHDLLMPPKR